MIAYSIIMFVVAVILLFIGISIRQGNTNLIHDYHQTNVRECDRLNYGHSFANGIFSICATLFISGIIALFGENKLFIAISLIELFCGLIISIVILVKVQKRFNGGVL